MFEYVLKYNPDQERGDNGRWVAVGFGKGVFGAERVVDQVDEHGHHTVRSLGRSPKEFPDIGTAQAHARRLSIEGDSRIEQRAEYRKPENMFKRIFAQRSLERAAGAASLARRQAYNAAERQAKLPSAEKIKQHNLDQISVLANDIRNNNGTREEQMARYDANVKPPRLNNLFSRKSFGEIFKGDGDRRDAALRAWETRRAGGEGRKEDHGSGIMRAFRDANHDAKEGEFDARSNERNLQFLSPAKMTPSEATVIMKKAAPTYNEFSAAKVGKILEKFPNVRVQVGREYSPVMYIHGSNKDLMEIAQKQTSMRAAEVHLYAHDVMKKGNMIITYEKGRQNGVAQGKPSEGKPQPSPEKSVLRVWWD